MKKYAGFILGFLVIIIVILLYIYTRPIDDSRKLTIKCEGESQSYELFIGDNIEYSDKNSKCYINLNVENIDRDYIKLNSKTFFYKYDIDGKLDKQTLSYDVYVSSGNKLELIGHDGNTKYTFIYK